MVKSNPDIDLNLVDKHIDCVKDTRLVTTSSFDKPEHKACKY